MAQLEATVRALQTTLASISQGILMVDLQGRVQVFNPRVCELLQVPARLLRTRPSASSVVRYLHERGDFGDQGALIEPHARAALLAIAEGHSDVLPPLYRRTTPAGVTLEVRTQQLPDIGLVRTFSDVSDYVLAQTELQKAEERWKLALESTGDGVWDLLVPSGEEYLSRNLLRMYGYEEGELPPSMEERDHATHPDDVEQMRRDRQAHLEGHTATYSNEHRVRCKDGSWKWVLSRGMVISRDAQGLPLRMIGTHTDITERKNAEALVWRQAHYDSLTGLPNRRMLQERLTQELKHCRRSQQQLALLFLDLDHFKEVNDTLGHDQGDTLLRQAGQRITACLRETDTVARMGGDEFTMLITALPDAQHLEAVLRKLLKVLDQAFALNGQTVFVSASIGVTLYPQDAADIEGLLKNADQALYAAKRAGRKRYCYFTPELQQSALARAQLITELRSALLQQQFRVHYQPIVDLRTGQVRKAEALVRWLHPERGLVSPGAFIAAAESSGLIVPLGEWVFQQAAQQVRQWRLRLHPQFQISVNKSPLQFESPDPEHLPWKQQLDALGLEGNSIAVEITEGLLLSSSPEVVHQLLGLRQDGVQISLDDFGTGYSSLSYLQKFDIDFVKIDQSFVRNLAPGSTNLVLCQAIVAMAHALGMQVVAEGVETPAQHDLLCALGCDYAQGYWFSPPLPAAEMETLCRNQPLYRP